MLQWLSLTSGGILRNFTCAGTLATCPAWPWMRSETWKRQEMPLSYTCCNDYAWTVAEFYGTSPVQGLWPPVLPGHEQDGWHEEGRGCLSSYPFAMITPDLWRNFMELHLYWDVGRVAWKRQGMLWVEHVAINMPDLWLNFTELHLCRDFGRVTWRRLAMPIELHMLQWLSLTSGGILRNFTCAGTLVTCPAWPWTRWDAFELHMLQW